MPFFFSEDLGILLGSPCGSGTDLGVLANISLFLQVLSLDPLQVVMELKLEESCSSGGDVPMPAVGVLQRSTKVLCCRSVQGTCSKANATAELCFGKQEAEERSSKHTPVFKTANHHAYMTSTYSYQCKQED